MIKKPPKDELIIHLVVELNYSFPSFKEITNPAAKQRILARMIPRLMVGEESLISTTIGEATTSPKMELYVSTSNLLNRNSINFAIANIPTTTPMPNGIKITSPPTMAEDSNFNAPWMKERIVSITGW